MGGVRTETAFGGEVVRLVVDQPRGNILTGRVMHDLQEGVDAAGYDRGVKLVTIEGAGEHFSFGASVDEHHPESVREMLPQLRELVMAIAAAEIPVACLVQGMCLGGAFEVALACHFIFAAENARMGLPEIRLGVFPPAAAALLVRKLGQSVADSLILTGEEWSGERLHRLGLVHQAWTGDTPWAHFEEWYRGTLARFSTASLRQAVRASRAGFLAGLEDELTCRETQYLDELMKTRDAVEGIASFIERRKPHWSHT